MQDFYNKTEMLKNLKILRCEKSLDNLLLFGTITISL